MDNGYIISRDCLVPVCTYYVYVTCFHLQGCHYFETCCATILHSDLHTHERSHRRLIADYSRVDNIWVRSDVVSSWIVQHASRFLLNQLTLLCKFQLQFDVLIAAILANCIALNVADVPYSSIMVDPWAISILCWYNNIKISSIQHDLDVSYSDDVCLCNTEWLVTSTVIRAPIPR
jgi:hypothetical protein